MAMVKPIAQSVPSFSADQAYKFTFISNGGNQVKYNRITIRNNITNAVVYQNKIETDELAQTVPSNTLTNGTYYNYYFNTYDTNNNESPNSNIITFYTYSTPTIIFTNIPFGNIDQASFKFNFTYNQEQGELLDSLFLYLYDTSGNLLQQSDRLTSQYAPPISMSYIFNGLEDGKSYKIQAVAKSINGTTISSPLNSFDVKYEYNGLYMYLNLENMCNDGYVKLTSNLRLIDGISSPNNPTYVDNNTKIDLENDSYVEWSQGYQANDDKFLIREKWKPILFGEFIYLTNDDGNNSIKVSLKRGIPNGETEPKDYFDVIGYKNGTEYFYQKSTYIDVLNNMSNVHCWVKKYNGSFELVFTNLGAIGTEIIWNGESDVIYNEPTLIAWSGESLSNNNNVIEWNGSSNVEFNKITDMFWEDEAKAETITKVPYYNSAIDSEIITSTTLSNSIVDYFDISKDMTKTPSTNEPTWGTGTILDCNFNGNINGSNVDFSLTQIDTLKFKRRPLTSLDWYTFKEIPVTKATDLMTSANDIHIPSGREFEWAIVPCKDGNEGKYFINSLKTSFDGIFISDSEGNIIKLFIGVTYASNTSNSAIGILQPLGSDVPVVIENGKVDYQTFSVTGDIFDKTFYDTRKIDRVALVEQQEKYQKILKNGKYKSLKDWNGRILIGLVTSSLTYTYNSNYGMGIPNVGFDFTEQGKYDDQAKMYKFGLTEVG